MKIPIEVILVVNRNVFLETITNQETLVLFDLYQNESDWRVRSLMVPELAKRPDLGISTLSYLYRNEEDKDVRRVMAPELVKRLTNFNTPALLDLYQNEDDEDVRQAMAPELARRPDLELQVLLDLYQAEDTKDVCQAMAPELAKRPDLKKIIENKGI